LFDGKKAAVVSPRNQTVFVFGHAKYYTFMYLMGDWC